MKNTYEVIGLMSGTSLDGLDIVHVEFKFDGSWIFEIKQANTVAYDGKLKEKLKIATTLSGEEIMRLDLELAEVMGQMTSGFMAKYRLSPDLIASHGHTIFHQPDRKFTFQAGNGQLISNITNVQVVSDFRIQDVLIGGQGAPLVPMGDELLFPDYEYCLNLGGIANISYREDVSRKAFDICPFNIPLNDLANQLGFDYDDGGQIANSGEVDDKILEELEQLAYYEQRSPKSLGVEWIQEHFFGPISKSMNSIENKLRTIVEHYSIRIENCLHHSNEGAKMLVTGGGAYNSFFISILKERCKGKVDIIVPSQEIVEYKEALIFGLLGILRIRNENNTLSSVTGSSMDLSSGRISNPN